MRTDYHSGDDLRHSFFLGLFCVATLAFSLFATLEQSVPVSNETRTPVMPAADKSPDGHDVKSSHLFR